MSWAGSCSPEQSGQRSELSRRGLFLALGMGGASIMLAACRGGEEQGAAPAARGDGNATDLPSRFASYEAEPEPNGNLSTVVWPAFITAAGPEVQRLYAFQIENGELMRYMPCFCGCGRSGHKNNRDCYIKEVAADGSVVFDRMAPT